MKNVFSNIVLYSVLIILFLIQQDSIGKKFKGAELRTHDTFTYGRFEARFIPAHREGVVSSLFTYHEISSTDQWNEIDIEFIGRYDKSIQVNAITPRQINHESSIPLPFNPYADFHTYAFEWTPSYVAWFVDGIEILKQTGEHVATLNRDQKIMMNIWPPNLPDWVGNFYPESLPARSYYDWFSYSSYTPGNGDSGSNNNFTFQWKDDFETYDSQRWGKGTHTWNTNNSDFVPENVQFADGLMILCLTKEGETGLTDLQAPIVLWAKENTSNDVMVKFGEEIDIVSGENKSNYFIPGATITNASLSDDRTIVKLSTENYNQQITYNVIVQNITDDEPTPNKMSTVAKSIAQTNTLNYPIKINIGGDSFDDYLADQEWEPNLQYGFLDGDPVKYAGNLIISNTENPQPYRSDRFGLVEYKINVQRGVYKITLQFTENYFQTSEVRIFDVTIEDNKIADNLDIFNEAGKNAAFEIESEVFVDDDQIDIYFSNKVDKAVISGIIVEQITTGVKGENPIYKSFELNQNFPNPFNPSTEITYTLSDESFVSLIVYDILGNEIMTLVNEIKASGLHTHSFNVPQLAAGIYLYQLIVDNKKSVVKKMILLK